MQIVTPVDAAKLTCWLEPVEPQPVWAWELLGPNGDDPLYEAPVRPGGVVEFWLPCHACNRKATRFRKVDILDEVVDVFGCECHGIGQHDTVTPVRRTVSRVEVKRPAELLLTGKVCTAGIDCDPETVNAGWVWVLYFEGEPDD